MVEGELRARAIVDEKAFQRLELKYMYWKI